MLSLVSHKVSNFKNSKILTRGRLGFIIKEMKTKKHFTTRNQMIKESKKAVKWKLMMSTQIISKSIKILISRRLKS